MSKVTPQNAMKLALWLAHEHPQLFALTHAKIMALKAQGTLSGLGCQCSLPPRARQVGRQTPKTTVGFGDTGFTFSPGDTGSYGFTLPAGSTALPGVTGISSWDSSIGYSGAGSTYPATGATTPAPGYTAPATGATSPAAGSTAPGSTSSNFWSNFSSDVGALGKAVAPAISDVASALGSPAGVAAIAGVASAYYQNQAASTEAQTVQTQIARTAAGQAPATIAGGTLYSSGSTTPVTSSLLSSLAPSSSDMILVILLVGALALVLAS
jgi:hypothetical protein